MSSDNIVATFELRDPFHAANILSISKWMACSVGEALRHPICVLGSKLELVNLTLDSSNEVDT